MTDESKCPLCGGSFTRLVIEESKYSIRECLPCRLGATLPVSYVSASEYTDAPQYADAYEGQEVKFRGYARHLVDWAQRYIKKGKLLDVGCSVGWLVDEARKAGFDAAGIDLDANAVRYAKDKGRAVFRASLEDWEHSDYDVITLSHTLEHVPDPIGFLQTCAARLREGGILVISVPCFAGLHPRLFRKLWYGWAPWQHHFHYSQPAFRRLFEKAGLGTIGTWQESMDHRPPFGYMRRRDMPQAVLSHAVATFGATLGQGDQLIGIARKLAVPAAVSAR